MENIQKAERDLKYFSVIGGLFAATLVLTNVLNSAKFVEFWWFVMPAGALLFPLTFIFGDILTEVYGYERSRKIIWTGFASVLLMVAFVLLVKVLPGASFWQDQEAYNRLFALAPRIAVASIVAYLVGEFCNSWVLSKMKYWDNGVQGIKQGWRFILSTIVGESIDTVIFMTIAFGGILGLSQMITVAGGLYVFKVLYEVIATPFSTRIANWLKKVEGVDALDTPEGTNYSPFAAFNK